MTKKGKKETCEKKIKSSNGWFFTQSSRADSDAERGGTQLLRSGATEGNGQKKKKEDFLWLGERDAAKKGERNKADVENKKKKNPMESQKKRGNTQGKTSKSLPARKTKSSQGICFPKIRGKNRSRPSQEKRRRPGPIVGAGGGGVHRAFSCWIKRAPDNDGKGKGATLARKNRGGTKRGGGKRGNTLQGTSPFVQLWGKQKGPKKKKESPLEGAVPLVKRETKAIQISFLGVKKKCLKGGEWGWGRLKKR